MPRPKPIAIQLYTVRELMKSGRHADALGLNSYNFLTQRGLASGTR